MRLSERITRIEQQRRGSGGVVVVSQQANETEDETRARWMREPPGRDLDAEDLVVFIRHFS